jgi:hypothetical protein
MPHPRSEDHFGSMVFVMMWKSSAPVLFGEGMLLGVEPG